VAEVERANRERLSQEGQMNGLRWHERLADALEEPRPLPIFVDFFAAG
jgi:hypothetical protein